MQKEYIGSLTNRHNLTEYHLSSGISVTLNQEELEELFKGSHYQDEIKELQNQLLKAETRLEASNNVLKLYKQFESALAKLKL